MPGRSEPFGFGPRQRDKTLHRRSSSRKHGPDPHSAGLSFDSLRAFPLREDPPVEAYPDRSDRVGRGP
jgi:hypothetical protein